MSKRGFTLVELVVVIAVIGILAAITLIGFSRYQADGRDARRASSVSAITEALEKYYDQNGEYPSCSEVTAIASVVTGSTLQGLSTQTLIAPQAADGTSNSIQCGATLTTNGVDFFSYEGDGSVACNGSTSCLNYTISYRDESTGTIKAVTSRRNTALATSGSATLSNDTLGFGSASFSWTAIPNAINYTLQRSTTAGFNGGTTTDYSIFATTSATINDLTANTNYWFRVRPTNAVGDGQWSNVLPVTTPTLAAPVVATTPISNTRIDLSWGSITNAVTYTLEYADNSGFTSSTTVTGITATSYSVTGLSTATQYWFKVKAVGAGNYQGPFSSVVDETTVVPAPSSITATTASSTQINTSWSSVSVADTYTLQYSTNSSFSSGVTTITGITGTTRNVTGLQQGTTWHFRVYALVGSAQSNASPNASATTTINTPGAPGVAASQPGAVRSCASGYWVQYPAQCPNNYYATGWITSASCPAGSYAVYNMYGRYNSPSTAYYSGATTASQWFLVSARSGYYTLWAAQYYCQGPNTNSGWGPWSGEART